MALVLMATHGWGTLFIDPDDLEAGVGLQSSFTNPADATAATHYADDAGASPSSGPVTADSNGRLMRWIEEGTYTQELPGGATLEVQALSGATLASVGIDGVRVMLKEGGVDNGAIINAALAALPARGGKLILDKPTDVDNFMFSTQVTAESLENVVIEGKGGQSDSPGFGTVLIYTGTASPAFNFKKMQGCKFSDIQFCVNNASFTGTIVDLQNDSGSGANDTRQHVFERCYFGGTGASADNATEAVLLDGALSTAFRDCTFMYSQYGVTGRKATGGSGYANVIRFDRCLFYINALSHTRNAGESWVFDNCTFQERTGQLAGAYTHDSGILAKGLTFRDCWWGDVLAGTSEAQIRFAGSGLVVEGGRMGVEDAGNGFIIIDANNCNGIYVAGVTFVGDGAATMYAVDFGATTGHKGFVMLSNVFETGIQPTNGTRPAGSIVTDTSGLPTITGQLDVTSYVQTYVGSTAAILLGNNGGQPGIFLGNAQDVIVSRLGTTVPSLSVQNPLTLKTYTTATKPAAANVTAGTVIFVSDGGAGAVFQGSTGAAWVNLG